MGTTVISRIRKTKIIMLVYFLYLQYVKVNKCHKIASFFVKCVKMISIHSMINIR